MRSTMRMLSRITEVVRPNLTDPEPPRSAFGDVPLGRTFAILVAGELVLQFAWYPIEAVIGRGAFVGAIKPASVLLLYVDFMLAIATLVFSTAWMIGWPRIRHGFGDVDSRAIAIIVIAACCNYVLVVGCSIALRDVFHVEFSAGYASRLFATSLGTSVAPYIAALIMLVIPMFDEFLSRGLLLGALVTRLGWGPAAWISSAVSSLLHFDPINFLSIMISSLLLAFVLRKTGSLWACYATHVVINTTAVLGITLRHLHH